MSKITRDMTLNQIIRDHPKTMAILNRYNIDICCGGADTLQDACRKNNLDPDTILQELQQVD